MLWFSIAGHCLLNCGRQRNKMLTVISCTQIHFQDSDTYEVLWYLRSPRTFYFIWRGWWRNLRQSWVKALNPPKPSQCPGDRLLFADLQWWPLYLDLCQTLWILRYSRISCWKSVLRRMSFGQSECHNTAEFLATLYSLRAWNVLTQLIILDTFWDSGNLRISCSKLTLWWRKLKVETSRFPAVSQYSCNSFIAICPYPSHCFGTLGVLEWLLRHLAVKMAALLPTGVEVLMGLTWYTSDLLC